jgi:hypothetical protein
MPALICLALAESAAKKLVACGEFAMNKNVALLLVFALALATAYAISQNPPAAGAITTQDQPKSAPSSGDLSLAPLAVIPAAQVQESLENALRHEPGLKETAIHVDVNEETIDLSGTVNSSKDKLAVHRLAESYAINRRVRDQVTVASQAAPSPASLGTQPPAQSHLQKQAPSTALNALQ